MFKIIYKNINESSFRAISNFQYKNNIKKIGHTGTLDVLAQGLLLVATDEYTKLIPYIWNKDKEYKVICKIGEVSRTYDAEGPIEFSSDYIPSENEIKGVLSSFIGKQKQIPPIYSAKKINGKKSYELARKNQEVNLKEIEIEIYNIEKIKYFYPFLEFTTCVSNGTYIRSLVHDLGQKLGTGSYMTFLERTMVNGLRKEEEINVNKLLNMNSIHIKNKGILKKIFEGKKVEIDFNNGSYLLEYKNNIIGIVIIQNKEIFKSKLFGKVIDKILKEQK